MTTPGGGDEPPRRSITNLFRSKKKMSRSTTTLPAATTLPATTPPTTTPPAATPSPPTTDYTQQMLLISQYDGPSGYAHQQPLFHQSSDQYTTLPHTPQPDAPSQPIIGSSSQSTCKYIEPVGHTFNPHGPPTHTITKIIRSNFFSAHVSWKKILREVHNMWFCEFKRDFHWLSQHHHTIRTNFDIADSKRLKDLFTDIRKDGKQPEWIGSRLVLPISSSNCCSELAPNRTEISSNLLATYCTQALHQCVFPIKPSCRNARDAAIMMH